MHTVGLALRLARRDLRGALGSFWILVLGIAVGVAAIAAVGSIAAAVQDGVRAGAHEAVGGDVSLRLFHAPATPEQRDVLAAAGAHSETAELRPLARRADGTRPTLVELKGVDAAYPLYGAVALDPAGTLAEALARRDGAWGAAVDDELLQALGVGIGERIRLGAIEATVRARIVAEPDRALRAFALGPRVMIARAALEESGLAPAGAQVYWYNRVRLAEGTDSRAWIAALEQRFPDAGWRIVDAADGVPGVERIVAIARVLLGLVGLSVLLIGGVGVGGAVSAHLQRKTPTIAVFKSLGASAPVVFAVYLVQVLAAAAVAVALGLALGALAPAALRPLARDWLPLAAGPQPAALAAAAAYGLLTALLFALWPLARARDVSPRALFRGLIAPPRTRPRPAMLAVMAVVATLLAALPIVGSGMPLLAGAFVAAAALTALLFLGLGRLIAWVAGRWRARSPLLRLALANLARPGAATAPVVMALGIGLTLLVAVKLIEGNALHHLATGLPEDAPEVVFLNIPPAEGAAFDAAVAGIDGVAAVQRVPFLHARLTHLDGEPAHRRRIPADVAWVVRGDRGLSWAAQPPRGGRVVAGAWWAEDYAGPPLASLDAEVARRLGLGVGSRLTLNVQGRPLEATVANLRRIDWTRLNLDFPVLLSPPPLPPPHSEVAAVWAAPAALDAVTAAVQARLPEAPAIRVALVLAAIGGMVEAAAQALAAVSSLAVAAALVVLAGSVAAGYRQRLAEMVLLKVVGARPRQLIAACLLEFLLLGSATAAIAAGLGTALAYAAVRTLMPERWQMLPATTGALALAALLVLAATGYLLARRALAQPAAAVLRHQQQWRA